VITKRKQGVAILVPSYEERVQTWLHHRLCKQVPGIWSGGKQITVEEVRLKQEDGELVITFRAVQYPDCLFGFRTSASPHQVIKPDGSLVLDNDPEGNAEIIYANLQEHVEAADMGLPKNCDPNSINWI
jgi:hypothetical protein